MKKIKKCKKCGNGFVPTNRIQIFCRNPCVTPSRKTIEEQNKAWVKKNNNN